MTVRSLDLAGPVAPALSTTSDMPTIAVKTEPPKGAVSQEEIDAGGTEALKAKEPKAEPEAKVEPKAEPKAEPEAKAEPQPKAEPEDKTPPWQKREITKARNAQRAAEERAAAIEARLDKALTALERAADGRKVETTDADPRPVRSAYDDPEAYDSALVAWSAKAAAKVTQAEIEKAQKERETATAKEKQEAEQRAFTEERTKAWEKSAQTGMEKYPDYEEVAMSDSVQITPAMAAAILEENLESGKGFEIAYHLGKNPEEAAKIASLPAHRQSIAIGRLAERLEKQPEKAVSKAPAPVKPVGNRAAAVKKSPAEETMEEYAARRRAELRAPH